MRSQKKNGAVLIMTLMALCLVFMMVHALMQSTGIGLSNSASFYDREAALEAAKSGVDFAVTRLRNNFGWRGDANCAYMNGSYQEIKTQGSVGAGFIISENNGNVVGLLLNRNKNRSAFRIKFSYQDNSTDTYDRAVCSRFGALNSSDMLPDKLPIKLPYVSINNLAGTSSVLAYQAKDDGVGISDEVTNLEYGSDEDGRTRAFAYHVPPQRICLIVEGLAGRGLRDCNNPEEVNELANKASWGQPITRRYVETYLTTVAPVVNGDAAYASDDISFDVQKKLLVSTYTRNFTSDASKQEDKSTVPAAGSLRSDKADIAVKNGVLNTFEGKLMCNNASFNPDTSKYTYLDAEGKQQEYVFGTTSKVDSDGTVVASIDWQDVSQSEDTEANAIVPGFYQWHKAPDSTTDDTYYQLRYYKDGCTYDEKGRPQPVNPTSYQIAVAGTVDSTASTEVVDGKTIQKMSMGPAGKISFVTQDGHITEPTLGMSGNLYCDDDFIIGSAVDEVTELCPKVVMGSYVASESAETGSDSSVTATEVGNLTVNGDIYIASSLFGSGAMVTNTGDIDFIGSSVLESGDCGVALYGNNVTLRSLEGAITQAPSEGAGQGKALDGDVSTDSDPTLNADGSKNIGLDKSLYDALKDSWEKSNPEENKRSVNGDIVADYINGLGVNAMCVQSSFSNLGTEKSKEGKGGTGTQYTVFWTQLKFCDSTSKFVGDCSYYVCWMPSNVYIIKAGGTLTEDDRRNPFSVISDDNPGGRGFGLSVVSNMVAPKESVISTTSSSMPENLQTYIEKFETVCYGDQSFTGVVYAKNNFKADLGTKFNLSVDGVIRAQNGGIDVTCANADLTYNEAYLTKLLPGFNKLTCKMWNCW